MAHANRATKRWIAAGLAAVFFVSGAIAFVSVRMASAADPEAASELFGAQQEVICDSAPLAPACVGRSIKETARVLGDRIVKPTFKAALVQGLLNISQFVVNRMAYEAALLVANGGPGEGSLFYKTSALEGFSKFGLEVAGEAVAELTDSLNSSLGTSLDLCLRPDFGSFGLQLGIAQKYQPQKPRCDILEVADNWGSFVSDTISVVEDPNKINSAITAKFAESLAPGRNELSASIRLNIAVTESVEEKKQAEIRERTTEKPAVKDIKDPTTRQTKTPAKVVENDFLDKIKKMVTGETTQLKAADFAQFGDAMPGLAFTAASTFTNTLLSQMFNKIYKGLFDTSPESQDPFNIERLADTGQNPETFSRLFAPVPFATAEYNALTEFVVCPTQAIANRSLNNCVMDSNFLAAVSRGNSRTPLTVQEAIGEGLLNGNWPLISSKDLSVNQDPLCYTFGFCYSNLVKLRKARVLPIGWELAAQRNSVSQPKTLQEIIDEFDNCNQAGAVDGAHPFCHLIDPNWVLKYPQTQCRALVNGAIRLTSQSPGRQNTCADAPSCLGENSKGECADGYGYCVREKNVWRFNGDECPSYYAGCLALKNTTSNQPANYLITTVDFSVCSAQNIGCQWYRTNKSKNAGATPSLDDDTFDWLAAGETYQTAEREDDSKYQRADGSVSARVSYSGLPARYAYEDRLYLTRAATSCSQSDAGCSEVVPSGGVVLNMVKNPSFEADENQDGIPDGWLLFEGLTAQEVERREGEAVRGNVSVGITDVGNNKAIGQVFDVQANQGYTLSYFAVSNDRAERDARASVRFYNAQGQAVSPQGTSLVGCDFANSPENGIVAAPRAGSEWKRHACTFSVPGNVAQIRVGLFSGDVRYDAIQLEPSESVSTFVEGLVGAAGVKKFVKLPPDYLGCTGALQDAPACASYAQTCRAQEVGCSLFTPTSGGPAVPAIAGELDACPSECVGYGTFKQEKTLYESAKFPLFFIPEKASACSAQDIGCDSFTNLSFAAEGGENVEHYTRLRACATPDMLDGAANKKASTFFTWEGSDNAGYQLRSWRLLESNEFDAVHVTYDFSGVIDLFGGKAPCTKWQVSNRDELICVENGAHLDALERNKTCDEHADIFTNPDCREFFDAEGHPHYRLFSETVTVSDQCLPYRKDRSANEDCQGSGGFWDQVVGACRYFGLASESASCPAAMNGCRAYTGGAGRNAVTALQETFESGTTSGYVSWPAAGSAALVISNESLATAGHSLRATVGNGLGGFKTAHVFLNGNNGGIAYDPSTEEQRRQTCSAFAGRRVTPAGCEIDADRNGIPECIVAPGEQSCGTLVSRLVKGKTYTIQFWAKGSVPLHVGFAGTGGGGDIRYVAGPENPVALSGGWQVYTLGPVDTSAAAFGEFDKDSVLFFAAQGAGAFYVDNLVLKQLEENVTLIKDSWVVPCTVQAVGVSTTDGLAKSFPGACTHRTFESDA